jgi:hypothetical protein
MQKFHCTYQQMMNEPEEIIKNNLFIMSVEAEQDAKEQKMQTLKSKMSHGHKP